MIKWIREKTTAGKECQQCFRRREAAVCHWMWFEFLMIS